MKKRSIEHEIQCAFFEACKSIPGCEYMHAIPNAVPVRTGGLSKDAARLARIIAQKHMTREGRKSGVLDVFNPKPITLIRKTERTEFTRSWNGLYIEFKRPASVVNGKKSVAGQLKSEQAEFILYADRNGYAVEVCFSVQEGVNTVLRYLRGEHSNSAAVALANRKLKL